MEKKLNCLHFRWNVQPKRNVDNTRSSQKIWNQQEWLKSRFQTLSSTHANTQDATKSWQESSAKNTSQNDTTWLEPKNGNKEKMPSLCSRCRWNQLPNQYPNRANATFHCRNPKFRGRPNVPLKMHQCNGFEPKPIEQILEAVAEWPPN